MQGKLGRHGLLWGCHAVLLQSRQSRSAVRTCVACAEGRGTVDNYQSRRRPCTCTYPGPGHRFHTYPKGDDPFPLVYLGLPTTHSLT